NGRGDLVEHRHVIGAAKAPRRDHDRDAGLLERVLELPPAVRRIDVDQDRARLGRRVLRDQPLGAVRAPEADAIAALDVERDQSARDALDFDPELAVREALLLMTGDERVAGGMRGADAIEA